MRFPLSGAHYAIIPQMSAKTASGRAPAIYLIRANAAAKSVRTSATRVEASLL